MESNVEREDDHTVVVVKGKRTKRSRQTFSVNTASSCSNGSRNVGGGGGEGSEISTCTDDDEDMANCLILLAQSGHGKTTISRDRSRIRIEGHANEKIITSSGRSSIQIEGVRISTPQIESDEDKLKVRKLCNKRFCEVATPINGGKTSVYGYECKTCNRIFSSFQALGGHRASHRKDWPSKAAPPPLPPPLPCSSESEEVLKKEKKQLVQLRHTTGKKAFCREQVKIGPPTIVTDLPRIFRQKNEKIHECSICNAEFPSGQALGGHMRKHRNIPMNITKNSCNNVTESCQSDNDDGGERSRNVLELDLNLPAPQEDDHHDSQNFQFSVLSFSTLMDCQY